MNPDQYAANAKTEHGHQVAVFMWAQQNREREPLLDLLYAIPNGGSRGDDERTRKIRGAALKAEGVKAGFPDIGLPVARHGYYGLFIEMKKPTGKLQSNQKNDWHPKLMGQNYLVQTVYDFFNARRCICWYLGLEWE